MCIFIGVHSHSNICTVAIVCKRMSKEEMYVQDEWEKRIVRGDVARLDSFDIVSGRRVLR